MPQYKAGHYLGSMKEWGLAESKNNKPYFYVDFEIQSVAGDGQWLPCDNMETRTLYLYLVEGAMDISLRQIGEMGFVGEDIDDLKIDPELRSNVQLVCDDDVYEGKRRERWSLPGNRQREHKRLEGNAVRALNAHWRKAKTPGKPTIPPPPTTKPTQADDVSY